MSCANGRLWPTRWVAMTRLLVSMNSVKFTIRERIDRIVDDGSFHEIGEIAGRAEYDEEGELKTLMPSNFCIRHGGYRRPAGDDLR